MIYIIDDPVRGRHSLKDLRIIDYSLFGISTELTCRLFLRLKHTTIEGKNSSFYNNLKEA